MSTLPHNYRNAKQTIKLFLSHQTHGQKHTHTTKNKQKDIYTRFDTKNMWTGKSVPYFYTYHLTQNQAWCGGTHTFNPSALRHG